MNKKVIFVATYPDKHGNTPIIESLEQTYHVLHPSFDWDSETGKLILDALGPDNALPTCSSPWQAMNLRDYWGVSKSDLVLYDLDTNPGTHFLGAAVIHQKKILAVSETLKGVDPYFSHAVFAIVKPMDLLAMLPTGM